MATREDVRAVAEEVQRAGWKAEVEPVIQERVPDLIVTDQEGRVWVTEVKTQRAPLHMADLGQVLEFRNVLLQNRPAEPRTVFTIIVTWESPTEYFQAAARDLGVEVLTTKKRGIELAKEFVAFLREHTGRRAIEDRTAGVDNAPDKTDRSPDSGLAR